VLLAYLVTNLAGRRLGKPVVYAAEGGGVALGVLLAVLLVRPWDARPLYEEVFKGLRITERARDHPISPWS
jgi:hypothetical protein